MIDQIITLCERAGEAILDIYEQVEVDVEYKKDDSPLTEADLAANRVLVDGLAELAGDIPVLSEESRDISYAERESWDRFWLVDPLDGTKEFLKRNGEFTVNVALIEGGRPVMGVVHAPDQGVTYWATQGEGAFKRDATGEDARLEVAATPTEPVVVVVSRSHINEPTQAFVERLREDFEVELMPVGSSLKLCMVAEDAAQIYPRLGPTMEWDTGAAQCVVEQAGGRVDVVGGGRLTYNKEDLLNPYFVAYAGEDFVDPEELEGTGDRG